MKARAMFQGAMGFGILTAALTVGAAAPASADLGACMQAAYGGGTLNCTANDVKIAALTKVVPAATDSNLFPMNGGYGCIAGQQIHFTGTFTVIANASQRYNIGLYVVDGGTSASTGSTCNRAVLNSAIGTSGYSTPYDNFSSDSCGDVTSSHSPYAVTLDIATTCSGTGSLSLPNCTSWLEKIPKNACTGIKDAIPGNTSKCNCDNTFTTNLITVTKPTLTISKDATETSVPPDGGTVHYSLTVTNSSTDTPVTLTKMTEHLGRNTSCSPAIPAEFTYDLTNATSTLVSPDSVTVSCDATTLGTTAPANSTTCRFTRLVSGSPGDKVIDWVTFDGTSVAGTVTSDPSNCKTISIDDVKPNAYVNKNVNPNAVSAVVTFQVAVGNNDKYSRPLTLTALTDTVYGNLADPNNQAIANNSCLLPTGGYTIDYGKEFTCTFDASVSVAGGVAHTNTITATITDPNSSTGYTYQGSATIKSLTVGQ